MTDTAAHTQIKVGLDVNDVVGGAKTAGSAVQKMAGDMSAASAQASKSFEGIGTALELTDKQASRAMSGMASQIRRSIIDIRTETATLASEKFQIKAEVLGFDKAKTEEMLSTLRQLEAEKVKIAATERTRAAQNDLYALQAAAAESGAAREIAARKSVAAAIEASYQAAKNAVSTPVVAANNAVVESLHEQADAHVKAYKAAQTSGAIQANTLNTLGMTAKGYNAALRNVPAQFTDIIVSLQGGQAPLTVLLQQGGQLKDMFGSVGAAAKALGGYLGGLLKNPYVLVAAGVAALGYAMYSAAKEAKALNDAVILSGNAAGLSGGQLQSMATNVGLTASALTEFAKSGAVGAANIEEFTKSAIRFERLTGTAVADTVKAFEDLKRAPVQASVTLNEKTNYLTASIYAQIKALEDQGKHIEAVVLAQQEYAKWQAKMGDNIEANLGPLDRMWKSLAENAKEFWKYVKETTNISPGQGITEKQIASQQKVVDDLRKKVTAPTGLTTDYSGLASAKEQLKIEEQRLFVLKSSASVEAGAAAERAKNNEKEKAGQVWIDRVTGSLPNQGAGGKRALELAKIDNQAAAGGNATPEQIAYQKALINAQFDTGASLAAVKIAEDAKLQVIAQAQSQARVLRETGALSEIGLIQETTRLELEAFDVRIAAAKREQALAAAKPNNEPAVEQLGVQIASLQNQRQLTQKKGLDDITISWDKQTKAIQATNAAMKAEDAAALTAEQVRLSQVVLQTATAIEAERRALVDSSKEMALRASLVGENAQVQDLEIAKLRIKLKLEEKIREIKNSGVSKENQALLINQATANAVEEANQTAQRITLDYWKQTVESIQNDLTDSIIAGIKGGTKSGFLSLRDAFVKEFENLVLRPQINAIVKPLAIDLAAVFGVTPGSSGAAGSSALGSIGGIGNTLSAFTGIGGETAKAILTGNMGITEGLSLGFDTLGASMADGLGLIAGSLAPIALGIGALSALSSAMQYSVDFKGSGISANLGANSAASTFNEFQQTGGLFGGGTTTNRDWAVADKGVSDYINATVSTATIGVKRYAAELGLSATAVDNFTKQVEISVAGLDAAGQKAAIDKAISGFFDEMVTSAYGGMLKALAKPDETSSATLQRIATDLTGVNAMFMQLHETLMPLSIAGAAAAAGLVDAFGGLDKMQSSVAAYYEKFYTETEKAASTLDGVNSAFAKLGVAVPASREQFRALVESIDITTASGKTLYAAIINLAPAFDQAAQAAQAAASNMLSAIQNWGTSADVRSFKATQLQQTLSAGGLNVDLATIMGATKDSVLAYYTSLDANSPTKKLLYDNQQAIYDFVTSGQAAAEVTSYGGGGGSSGATAAQSISNAWQAITDSIWGEVERIRGLIEGTGTEALAAAQVRFTIATAQARAGDQNAAQSLPQLSQNLLLLAEANASTSTQLKLIQAQTAGSLSLTGLSLSNAYGTTIPSQFNPALTSGLDMSALLAELRSQNATLNEILSHSQTTATTSTTTAKTLVNVTQGGSAMQTQVAT